MEQSIRTHLGTPLLTSALTPTKKQDFNKILNTTMATPKEGNTNNATPGKKQHNSKRTQQPNGHQYKINMDKQQNTNKDKHKIPRIKLYLKRNKTGIN